MTDRFPAAVRGCAAFLFALAAALTLAFFPDPLYRPGVCGTLLPAAVRPEDVSAVVMEDGWNLPVMLEKNGSRWFVRMDADTVYPADNARIQDFVVSVTGKRLLLPAVLPGAGTENAGNTEKARAAFFPLRISFFSAAGENAERALFFAGPAEAGGGYRYVRLPETGIFRTGDFFAAAGIDGGENVMAMRAWIERTPFREYFSTSGEGHGNIQRLIFRDFSAAGEENCVSVFQAGDPADREFLRDVERRISGIECLDVTNFPAAELFSLSCMTGFGGETVFSFALFREQTGSGEQALGMLVHQNRRWVIHAGTVADLLQRLHAADADGRFLQENADY